MKICVENALARPRLRRHGRAQPDDRDRGQYGDFLAGERRSAAPARFSRSGAAGVHRDFDAAIPQRRGVADQSRATGGMAQADALVRRHRRLSQYHGESDGRRPPRVDSGGAGFGESLRCAGRAAAFRPHVSRAGGRLRPAPGGDSGGFDLAATVRRRSLDRGAQDHAGGRAVYGGGRSAAGFRIPEAARRYGQAPERTHGDFPALGVQAEPDCAAQRRSELRRDCAAGPGHRDGRRTRRTYGRTSGDRRTDRRRVAPGSDHDAASTTAYRECAAEPDRADGGGGRGAAGTLRQPGEPFAVAGGRAGPRGGDSHRAGSEPVATGATIAGGNERACRAGRRSRRWSSRSWDCNGCWRLRRSTCRGCARSRSTAAWLCLRSVFRR